MDQNNDNAAPKTNTAKKHVGACHCGAVRFEATVDATAGSRCNCSICTKTSVLSGMCKPEAFALTAGAESLSDYEWGGKISRRFFCKHCGVQCFARGHLAELGGDYVAINLNALEDADPIDAKVIYWDGRHNNWHAGPRSSPWPIVTAG